MIRSLVAAIILALATPALAQQPQSPSEQALAQKLMTEISGGIQCSAAAITLQQQLAAAQTEIKELKAKLPKAEPDQK